MRKLFSKDAFIRSHSAGSGSIVKLRINRMHSQETAEETVKEKMGDLTRILSLAEVSRKYFRKSSSWLYHKINGIDGNGNPTSFTDEELETLRQAMNDISEKLKETAGKL